MSIRLAKPLLALGIAAALAGPAFAADLRVTPPAAGGFSVRDPADSADRLRVDGDGSVAIPGLQAADERDSVLCFDDASGALGPCAPGAITGPAGPAGPAGATGATGPAGASGAAGPTGPAGETGPAGSIGPAGAAGPAGPAGANGPAGPAGPQGAPGTDGAPGPAGSAGPAGAIGPAGPQGEAGPAGAAGPQGASGADGAQGPAGATGPAGVQGPAGVAGPAGPAGTAGADGAVGPTGSTGPAGTIGPQGPAGEHGAPGAAGAPGAPGAPGTPGTPGEQGEPGTPGAPGAPGGAKASVSINGTLSTAMALPLYPLNVGGPTQPTTLISQQSYIVTLSLDGIVAGSGTALFESNDCSGPVLVQDNTGRPGHVLGYGNGNRLFYIARTGSAPVASPTRNSRSTLSIVCEAGTSALTGSSFYRAQPNVPATTGVDLPARPLSHSFNYIP